MGIILLDYICRTRKALGTMPEHPVAVTTIVSTDTVSYTHLDVYKRQGERVQNSPRKSYVPAP